MPAPVALFVYNRPWHTQQTIEALLNNSLATQSDLFVFSDAARTHKDTESVDQVRAYLKTVTGFKSIQVVTNAINKGLSVAITSGVNEILSKFDSIIVVEDDLITSPFFLSFMNQALNLYEADENVICINGYTYPVFGQLPDSFFIKGADCQGWATWARGWKEFNPNGTQLLHELRRRNLIREFNYDNSYSFSRILSFQTRGLADSWAIRWYASAFLKNKLTLYPGVSMVKNIGFDNTGSNSSDWDKKRYETEIRETEVYLKKIETIESREGRLLLVDYFRRTKKPFLRKVKDKIISILKQYSLI